MLQYESRTAWISSSGLGSSVSAGITNGMKEITTSDGAPREPSWRLRGRPRRRACDFGAWSCNAKRTESQAKKFFGCELLIGDYVACKITSEECNVRYKVK